jgi:hypothetical protein
VNRTPPLRQPRATQPGGVADSRPPNQPRALSIGARGGGVESGCCDFHDPPLPGSPHSAFWEAQWGMTVEDRWLLAKPDDDLDEILREVMERDD